MSTLNPATIENIVNSLLIMASFQKYGTHAKAQTKISLTFHTTAHAYTVEAWATISHRKFMTLSGWTSLVATLKPINYTYTRTNKATGEDVSHTDEDYAAQAFEALCEELARRTSDNVHLDCYQSFKKG